MPTFSPDLFSKHQIPTLNWPTSSFRWITGLEDVTHPSKPLFFLPKHITPLAVFSIQWWQLHPVTCSERLIHSFFFHTPHVIYQEALLALPWKHLQPQATFHHLHHYSLGLGHCPLSPGLPQYSFTSFPMSVLVPLSSLSKAARMTLFKDIKQITPLICLKFSKLSRFSHVWLLVTLWTVAHQAPLSMGFSRQRYWSGVPFPPLGDL